MRFKAERRLRGFSRVGLLALGAAGLSMFAAGCQFSPLRAIDATPSSAMRGEADTAKLTHADESVEPPQAEDGLFVGLALSGGGSRSAVFATQVITRLEARGVMRRVDYISGVSGGCIAGAYYCLSRDPQDAGKNDIAWKPDTARRIAATNFWPGFLVKGVNPINIGRYYFTGYNRSTIMAETFDEEIFRGKTLADLNPKRPKLLINATRLDTGSRFAFTNQQLTALSVDPRKLRVADAVQSSAAFPGFFQPRALPEFDKKKPHHKPLRYVHLSDAGVFDNLGVAALFHIYKMNRQSFPKGAVFIIADASMPPIMSPAVSSNPDLREGVDYFIDLRTAETSFDIVYEISRITALIHLDDHRESDNLRIIHLSYAAGLLESEHPATQPSKRRLIDTDKPVRAFVDLGKAIGVLAPTSLSITDERAESTRNSADRVLENRLDDLREEGLLE